MAQFHILSKSEVSALLKRRVTHYQEEAKAFIQSRWDDPQDVPHAMQEKLVRLLAATDLYNGDPTADELLKTYRWIRLPDDKIEDAIYSHIRSLKYNDDILASTIKVGVKNRADQGTVFPSVFKESDRIYIQVPTVKNHTTLIQDLVRDFNTCLPPDQQISYHIDKVPLDTSYYITDKSSKQPVCRFLGRKLSLLDLLSDSLKIKSPQEQHQLAYQIQTREMYQYAERDGHPLKIDWLKRDHHITLDSHLYAYIQHHLKDSSSSLTDIISPLSHRLLQLKKSISFEQDRQGDDEGTALAHDTDLIILSKSPRDIAWCSAYTDYEEFSCMNPRGFMHHYIKEDIAYGTLVAYMVSRKNPHKRYSRILLKPYYNEHHEPVYFIGKTHGEKNYIFYRVLKQFARDYLNSSRTSTYTIDSHLYPDSEPQQIVYSRLLENGRE